LNAASFFIVAGCLRRIDDKVKPNGANEQMLRLYAAELAAETAYNAGDYASASEKLQKLLDGGGIQLIQVKSKDAVVGVGLSVAQGRSTTAKSPRQKLLNLTYCARHA